MRLLGREFLRGFRLTLVVMASSVVVLVGAGYVFGAPVFEPAPGGFSDLSATGGPVGHTVRCADQSGADFDDGFTSRHNLVVGPFAMTGGRRLTSAATVREFGGNKFAVLVRPGHRVTLSLSRRANRSASLFYEPGGGFLTETRVRDGRRSVTFGPCSVETTQSTAGGEPVAFWMGFIVVSKPMCLRIGVWVDEAPEPVRSRIPLGRRC